MTKEVTSYKGKCILQKNGTHIKIQVPEEIHGKSCLI